MSDNTSTDLIISLPKAMTAETFTDDKEFEKLYAKVKEAVDSHVPDLSTKTGRDAIASVAYKVARTKTALIKQGKALTEGWREQTKKVNAACNTIGERLDKLKEDVRRPLTEWEEAEEKRVADHQKALRHLVEFSEVGFGRSSADIRQMITEVEAMAVCELAWEEFTAQASVAKQNAIDTLNRLLVTAEKQEADALELERLRVAQAERERQDAERIAADEAAKAEAERAEQERQAEADRVERERLAEEQRKADIAKAAEEAAANAQREAAEKLAAAEKAAQDAKDQAAREIAQAKEAADRKAEADRKRIADEQAAAAEEQRRRDADKEHRKTVNQAIVAELIECAKITPTQAQKIVVHMVSGLVPNVTLKY